MSQIFEVVKLWDLLTKDVRKEYDKKCLHVLSKNKHLISIWG